MKVYNIRMYFYFFIFFNVFFFESLMFLLIRMFVFLAMLIKNYKSVNFLVVLICICFCVIKEMNLGEIVCLYFNDC